MQQQQQQKHLIKLKDSSEQEKYHLIKQKLSKKAKYYYDIYSITLMVCDQNLVYLVSDQQTRVVDLGKQYTILQLLYLQSRNVLIFSTQQGHLHGHFIQGKSQFIIKKDIKNNSLFGGVHSKEQLDFFLAEGSSVKLMKIDQEKKSIKEVKSLSGKYNSFLYEPNTQVLVCFPTGDCKNVHTFFFDDDSKAKNWFKGPQISLSLQFDEPTKAQIKKNKGLGLQSSHLNSQLFHSQNNEDSYAELINLNNICFMIFYFGNEGKLKLLQISQNSHLDKQISIKLPSDCTPTFNVVDNMLIIHMTSQRITFIYDINSTTYSAQMLVSPFPVQHASRPINPYQGIFRHDRHIMSNGDISKWQIRMPVIFYYLKNEIQIFEFLMKRSKGKPELLIWLKGNLFKIKQMNLSRFWKQILIANSSVGITHGKQPEYLTLADITENIFSPLAQDQLIQKQALVHIILECLRQAKQTLTKIPIELQKLTFQLLAHCKKYETLVFLCHNDIIKDNSKFVQNLLKLFHKEKQQILFTLAIDMANRVCHPQKVFEIFMENQQIWEAKRYLKNNFDSIQTKFVIQCAKNIVDLQVREEYVKLVRAIILRKMPSISEKYLDEAQKIVWETTGKKKEQEETYPETLEVKKIDLFI